MKNFISLFTIFGLLLGAGSLSQAQSINNPPPTDGVFEKIHSPLKKPISYVPIREADVMWSKRIWRVIDFREKMNECFYYPIDTQNIRRNFMSFIMQGLKEGTMTAYEADPFKNPGDEFNLPLTYFEIMSRFERSDTLEVEDIDNPGVMIQKIVKARLDPTKVKRLRLKEDWFFDKQRSLLDVRIIGICPMYEIQKGDSLDEKPMFWIYFPEARNVFAQAEVFNRYNDVERRTYDELFWKRVFGSYIYKESNVFDRKITEYTSGIDALLESERIKNDLFEFEHDLWEF